MPYFMCHTEETTLSDEEPGADEIQRVYAERDRYRKALEMIAIPPAPEYTATDGPGCLGCAKIAQAALEGP